MARMTLEELRSLREESKKRLNGSEAESVQIIIGM